MNDYGKYYTEKLYPLMDGILNLLKASGLPFYLTGGTALSRGYFNHRYSDDIDLFVNQDNSFPDYVRSFLKLLENEAAGLNFYLNKSGTVSFENYISFQIHSADEESFPLKIDLINDVAEHYGDFLFHPVLGKTDSLRNILSNKITAAYRLEPKDIVDIWIICKNTGFLWQEIFAEAQNKQIGVDPLDVSNIVRSFPVHLLEKIKWTETINFDDIQKDFDTISKDILTGNENSLSKKY